QEVSARRYQTEERRLITLGRSAERMKERMKGNGGTHGNLYHPGPVHVRCCQGHGGQARGSGEGRRRPHGKGGGQATCPLFHIRRVRCPLNNRCAERRGDGFRTNRGGSVR